MSKRPDQVSGFFVVLLLRRGGRPTAIGPLRQRNENWEFDALGYMKRRFASINDLPIREADRKFHWERIV